ncbi:hypothetical protein MUK42_01431 [Musa troglodytarum]|uniref:Uncharacterized protein n=1 Tax=Musa troglodytarum TaxID=320322 RepID=A0A9E7G224_9LILI|nr:hypothetical protein MUK42_01431 [Musa troglodytarum]
MNSLAVSLPLANRRLLASSRPPPRHCSEFAPIAWRAIPRPDYGIIETTFSSLLLKSPATATTRIRGVSVRVPAPLPPVSPKVTPGLSLLSYA